ncbi:MAG: hypothetical protein JXJ04_20935, partial [Spirochaetales bacterium]|nr:hypothetical protein [Spirochaetales bacterium]
QDESTFVCETAFKPEIDSSSIVNKKEESARPVNILILGWNDRVIPIIAELDYYLAKGSKVSIIAESDQQPELKKKYKNIKKVEFTLGDTTHRELLEAQNLGNMDHIIILPYSELYDEKQADARTLNTLLHLRDLGNLHGYKFSIVSEMLDVRNRELAQADRPDDFVVSDSLISMVLAQVSENKALAPIFSILLNPGGVEIYLRPAHLYIKPGNSLNFYSVVEAASLKGEIAIGYRITAEKNELQKKYGVYLNPDKADMITLKEEDQIIVIAEV